jgi:multiple sugar transport system permease protein
MKNQEVLSVPAQKVVYTEADAVKRKRAIKRNLVGYAMISPWLIGFLAFVIGPMIASFYLSFTNYDMLSSPKWIGFDNYIKILTDDPRFIQSLKVTLVFVFISTPLKLAFALFLAMLFNTNRKGTGFFTTVYYIPSIIGGSVAIAVVWKQLFGNSGAINGIFGYLGVGSINWIGHPDYALSVLILLIIWQFGSPMIIFLAGLRQIPAELYEAASVDGAGAISKFFKITIPMLTPVIFFNLIMQTIGGFMTFTQSYLITKGGPMDSTLFYSVYLYETAFQFLQMGYASAMAWILLVIIALITVVLFKTSSSWVHYESEGGRN